MNERKTDDERFELALREAINVKVPEGLTQRILNEQAKQTRRSWWKFQWLVVNPQWRYAYATAATLLLLVGVFVASPWFGSDMGSLEKQVLAYLHREHDSLTQVRDVPDAELAGMFQEIGAKVTGDLGKVSHCEITEIGDHKSATLVMSGDKGPVTVVFILDERIRNRKPLGNGGLSGIIVPAQKGSIAIVGESGEGLTEVESKVKSAVTWL